MVHFEISVTKVAAIDLLQQCSDPACRALRVDAAPLTGWPARR
jgi:hypothetical protein